MRKCNRNGGTTTEGDCAIRAWYTTVATRGTETGFMGVGAQQLGLQRDAARRELDAARQQAQQLALQRDAARRELDAARQQAQQLALQHNAAGRDLDIARQPKEASSAAERPPVAATVAAVTTSAETLPDHWREAISDTAIPAAARRRMEELLLPEETGYRSTPFRTRADVREAIQLMMKHGMDDPWCITQFPYKYWCKKRRGGRCRRERPSQRSQRSCPPQRHPPPAPPQRSSPPPSPPPPPLQPDPAEYEPCMPRLPLDLPDPFEDVYRQLLQPEDDGDGRAPPLPAAPPTPPHRYPTRYQTRQQQPPASMARIHLQCRGCRRYFCLQDESGQVERCPGFVRCSPSPLTSRVGTCRAAQWCLAQRRFEGGEPLPLGQYDLGWRASRRGRGRPG